MHWCSTDFPGDWGEDLEKVGGFVLCWDFVTVWPSSETALCPLLPYYCVFFISQICFWDHKYVFHLCKVFYHLVEVIFNSFASMFLTLCPNLPNFRTSSHVPREMSHMASLVYSKIWDFRIFCIVLYSLRVHNGLLQMSEMSHPFFPFCLILLVSTVRKSLSCWVSHFFLLTVPIP